MLIADGGGGGTAWQSLSMDDMQRLIQNPDTEKHWDLVGGWQKSAELVSSHLFQVQSYRDNLAAVWPPEKSAASAAYLARLDVLIGHLTETHEAALANHDALSAATLSLSLAQSDVQKIYDEYQANQQLLLNFETEKQEKAANRPPIPSPRLSPGGEEPPVAPGRQEELRQKAALLLSGVSSDLAQAQMRLVRPKPYSGTHGREEETTPNDGQAFTAPPLPPIVSGIPAGGITESRSAGPLTTFPTNVPTSQAPIASPTSGVQQPGLVLGGTNTPTATPLPSVTPPTAPAFPNGTSGPIGAPSLLPPGVGNVAPGATGLPGANPVRPPAATGPSGEVGIPREAPSRPGGSTAGGLHAMPPGGMIGAAPGVGLSQPAARPTPRRINPVGGVIGEGVHGNSAAIRGNPVNAHTSSFSGPYGQSGIRRKENSDQMDGSHWDPNNPWATTEGVDPVLMPPREQRIDPGPAIGLN